MTNFNDILIELNREKHPLLVAVEKEKGHIMVWNHGAIQKSFGVDGIPGSSWKLVDQRKTVPEIFNLFKESKGILSLVYTDLRGSEFTFIYGSEKTLPFNWLMQKRWELRLSPKEEIT